MVLVRACSSVYRMRACPKHAWLLVFVLCCIAHGLDLSVLGSQSEDARRPTPTPLERYGGLDALIAWRYGGRYFMGPGPCAGPFPVPTLFCLLD